jgi:hypothetical protein
VRSLASISADTVHSPAAAKLFSRRFSDVKGGKHVVVVVVSSGEDGRHWIITAYITRKLAEGDRMGAKLSFK